MRRRLTSTTCRNELPAGRTRRRAAALLGLAWLSLARTVHAQSEPSIDARSWRPPTDPRAGLVLEPVTTPGPWQWNVAVWGEYAQDPVRVPAGTLGGRPRPVENAIGTDLVLGIGLGTRAAVGLAVPFSVWQGGHSNLPSGIVQGGAVSTTGIGDVSLIGKATIVENERQGLQSGLGLGAVADVTLPTGGQQSFMGEGAVTASLRALGEYAVGAAAVRATLGYSARTVRRTWPETSLGGVTFGDSIDWSAGIVLHPKAVLPAVDPLDRQTWEVAVHGRLPAGPVAPFGLGAPGASALSPAMLAIDDRVGLGGKTRDAYVVAGVDVGLDGAVGVPSIRALVSIGWAPRRHDRDGDGVPDDVDQCPDLPEDRDGIQDDDGCPEDDADGDGILDEQDACPLVAGVASENPKKNGCPAAPPNAPPLGPTRAAPPAGTRGGKP